jgi:hypothetical protein
MRLARPTRGLRWYFDHNDGRMIDKWDHYLDVYERYFRRVRGAAPTMLEIGVSHGGSLQMWRSYFGWRSTIVGIDREPRVAGLAGRGVEIEVGSQSDTQFLAGVARRHGPFDIVLDDGSHWYRDQCASLEALWPNLADGGVYMVEDVHTSYLPAYEGGVDREDTFIGLTRKRIDDIHRFWFDSDGPDGRPNDWTRTLGGIHVHDSIVVFDKTSRTAPRRRMTGRPAFDTIYGYPADEMITDEHREQLASLGSRRARVRRAVRDPRGALGRLRRRIRPDS